MNTLHLPLEQTASRRFTIEKMTSAALVMLLLFGWASVTLAQASGSSTLLKPRITAAIEGSSRVTLAGSRPPRAVAADDVGAVPASMKLQGITLVFSLTAAQQTALNALIAAQQNPSSAQYHQWLTPDDYAARFGMASEDIAAVQNWLEQQGFSVESVSRSRNSISFSGTAGQVESAFGAPLHYFKSAEAGATKHFAPAADLSLPAALSPVVLAVRNISDFRPQPHFKPSHKAVRPKYTTSAGDYYLDSKDTQTIYDVTPAYAAGYTGTGESLAIVGQSAVVNSDINAYQTTLGYPASNPNLVLMPGTGLSTINPAKPGDEAESDLDLEYSSTMAPGATIYFVYTGANTNYGAFDALTYAVDNKVASIISSSYGDCETHVGQTEYNTLNAVLAQAAAQGQTVIAAAGDDGSTDCYADIETSPGSGGLTVAQGEALAVDFPASSQYVTGMGGTEFLAADVQAGNTTYFAAAPGTNVVSSALSYIPEQAWNDDSSAYGLSAGGGGTSSFTPRPTWQTGVPGIVAGSYRLVPDISLDASNVNAPYAFCTSDQSEWNTEANGGTPPYQESSCTNGLLDEATGDITAAGGTSFDAPSFSGMLAVLNQARGFTTGQGVVNPTLYALAANASMYASAFHDITIGGNQCSAGSSYCSGTAISEYITTTGYDEATGLGSIDFYKLLTAWPGTATASSASFTVTAANTTVTPGTNGTSTVTVTPASSFTGGVNFTVYGPAALTYACYSLPAATVSGTTAATSTLTIVTNAASCASGTLPLVKSSAAVARNAAPRNPVPANSPAAPLGAVTAGVLLAAFSLKRRTRLSLNKLVRVGLSLILLAALGLGAFGLSGCSSSAKGAISTTTTTTTTTTSSGSVTPAGTYTITVTGVSASNASLVSSATFTLTVS